MCLREFCRGLAVTLAFAPLVAAAQAADDDAGLWTLAVGMQADDEASNGASVALDYALAADSWLLAQAGRSRSPRERADVSAASYMLGIDHRFGRIGTRFDIERWGDRGAVESTDYSAAVYVQSDRIRLELGYETRDIDISFTAVGPLGREFSRKVPLDAEGMKLSLGATLSDRLRLSASVQHYDYARDLSLLPRIAALNLLSTSTLTLANSFVDRIETIGLDIELGEKIFSTRFWHDRSAVDGSALSSVEAALLVPVGRRTDLELSLGRSSSDVFEGSTYAGLLVLVYGGG
jgi:hypothetical protein